MAARKKKYRVISNVSFKDLPPGKNLFEAGDIVELTDKQAEKALELGLIELDEKEIITPEDTGQSEPAGWPEDEPEPAQDEGE